MQLAYTTSWLRFAFFIIIFEYIRQLIKCFDFKLRNNTIGHFIFVEAATGGVLWNKVFLKISQNSQENTFARVSFLIKLQASAQLFSLNFVKFLKTPFYRTRPDDYFCIWVSRHSLITLLLDLDKLQFEIIVKLFQCHNLAQRAFYLFVKKKYPAEERTTIVIVNFDHIFQKQPLAGVLQNRCT